jgi:hypothetical protein
MSHEEWPSDQKIESISRMARQSSDFSRSGESADAPRAPPALRPIASGPGRQQADTKVPSAGLPVRAFLNRRSLEPGPMDN